MIQSLQCYHSRCTVHVIAITPQLFPQTVDELLAHEAVEMSHNHLSISLFSVYVR